MRKTLSLQSVSSRGSSQSLNLMAIIGIGLASILVGLVAVSANPVVVALAVALLVGIGLMLRPTWMIWLILVFGLLIAGIIPIIAEGMATKAVWGISGLGFALMGAAFFSAITRSRVTENTPSYVWFALAFILYSLFNAFLNLVSIYEIFSGFKRYFQATGLLFALAWLPIGERDIKLWCKFFIVVALLQLPFAIFELVKLVPIRESFRYAYPDLVPIDIVAGTFGSNMTSGGANAEMATFLIIVLAFLLSRMRDRILSIGQFVLLVPIVITPLFLGETKAVVVMLPMMFLTLYRGELLSRPHYALVGLLAGSLLTFLAGYAYVEVTKMPLDRLLDVTMRYNFYEKGYGVNILNRTTVLTFWASQHGFDDPAGAIIGHGLGTAHDSTGGEIARRYLGYGISLTAASTLLWEQGLLGIILFLAVLTFAWRSAGRVRQVEIAPLWARADADAIQASLPLFLFYLIYRSSLIELMTFQIVFWSVLGYLAWLSRRFGSGRVS